MMNFLEESRNRLVRLLFPFAERFYLVVSLVLMVTAWSLPETLWQIKTVLVWLWFVISEIHSAGVLERDYLPIRPGNSPFYRVYRFTGQVFFLFLPVFLVILLIPGPLWLKWLFCGVFFLAVILRAMGDWKYRPKKPEES